MPLVGGELARAAFEHGFEEYAVQQLLKYEELTRRNETYLWYFPDGRVSTVETSTSPEAVPTDGWGSSAMMYALMEGLGGVVDEGKLFQRVRLSPRWVAAGCREVSVGAAYNASGAFSGYRFAHDESKRTITLEVNGAGEIDLHILLPAGAKAKLVKVNQRELPFKNTRVEQSPYVDARLRVKRKATVRVQYGQ